MTRRHYVLILCTKCSSQSEQLVRAVIELAVRGSWICPFANARCGEIDGATQEEMRELTAMPSRYNPMSN